VLRQVGHSNRSEILHELAISLCRRFGKTDELHKPSRYTARYRCFDPETILLELANCLASRIHKTRNRSFLEEVISLKCEELAIKLGDDPGSPGALRDLAVSLDTLFRDFTEPHTICLSHGEETIRQQSTIGFDMPTYGFTEFRS